MTALTITLPLSNFRVTEIQSVEYKFLIYGEAIETSVNGHVFGKLIAHFHDYDEERCVEYLPSLGGSVFIFYGPKCYICKEYNSEGATSTTIVDRYHVEKLYRTSAGKFRQQMLKELKQNLSVRECKKIKHVTHIFNMYQGLIEAMDKFMQWILSVRKGKLTCFNKYSRSKLEGIGE